MMKWFISIGLTAFLVGCYVRVEEEKVYYLDVRSEAEFNEGHIEGAVNIPHTEVGERIGEMTEDKSAEIILYCRSGGRAGRRR